MSTIDLNRVRLFVRVAEAGSFTAAARLSGLPTSSVSRAVAALERELAVRLIQRTTRRLQLTEAGRVYYESVSRALSGMDEAAAAVSELQDAPHGRVRITAAADLGHWLLAPSLVRFATRYPEVQIEVSPTQRIVDLVHEGFDLALRVGKLADNRLVARALGPVRAGYLRGAAVPQATRPAALGRRRRRPRVRALPQRVGSGGLGARRPGGAAEGRGPGRGRRGRQRVHPRGGRGRAGPHAAPDLRVLRAREGRPPARAPGVRDRRRAVAARVSDRAP